MSRLSRRTFLAAMPVALAACSGRAEEGRASAPEEGLQPAAASADILVHKTPTCGCCGAWVDHLRSAGFSVEVEDVPDTGPMARRLGVPDALRSCHTAEIEGYAVEGHVPAVEIRRLVAERPDIAGIAVPGMPVSSPGMEVGDRRDPYQVIAFRRDGTTEVFASY